MILTTEPGFCHLKNYVAAFPRNPLIGRYFFLLLLVHSSVDRPLKMLVIANGFSYSILPESQFCFLFFIFCLFCFNFTYFPQSIFGRDYKPKEIKTGKSGGRIKEIKKEMICNITVSAFSLAYFRVHKIFVLVLDRISTYSPCWSQTPHPPASAFHTLAFTGIYQSHLAFKKSKKKYSMPHFS